MGELTVLVTGPFAVGEVEVVWRAEEVAVSEEARERIERKWGEYVADAERTGRVLFNGTVTRLIGAERTEKGVRVMVGPGDYKGFVVTVMRDREWFLKHAPEAMVFALGNSVLLTHGERAVLGVRAMRTSAYGGRVHVIGGVLDLLMEGQRSAAGLIGHLQKEIAEETRVGVIGGEPRLLGVVRDEVLSQPELVWQWEVGMDVEEVGRGLDAHEHEGYVILEKGGVATETYERMTPVARAAWEWWRGR